MKKYGHIISELRKKKGLTQEQLGKKLNVSYQAVSKWENNLSEPDLETLEKMTDVFEISMSEFFALSKDGDLKKIEQTEIINQEKQLSHKIETKNFIKTKPWILIASLSVLAVALLFIAIFVPFKLSAEAIYNKINPSIFYIKTQTINGYSNTGTGFFINDSGLAVVDYDVVENCESGYIKFSDDEKYNIKYLVGVDEDLEIAIIQIDIKKSKGVSIANSNRVSIAEKVYTIGYSSSSESSLAETLISKVNYSNKNKYFQILTTSARDGSVLVNEQGKVVGMVSDRYSGDAGFDVAIPINNIKNIKHKYKVTLKEYYEMHKTFYFYSKFHDYTKEYVVGEKIEPLELSNKGYAFDGWYTDETYTTKFDFSKPITTQNCCYAKWIPNTYTIKFDNGGSLGTMQDLTATYDMEMELPTASFTKQFYKFIGWKREGSNELLADCSTIKNLASEEGQVVTLKATWEMIKYTIYFDPNGGSTGTDVAYYEQIFIYDQQQTLHPNQYSKQGYKFAGWLYDGEIYQDEQSIEKLCETEQRITFIAQWTPIKYTIRFTNDDQSYDQEIIYDQPTKLISNRFEKENYYFSNWHCSELWNLIRDSYYEDEEEIINLTDVDGKVFEFKAIFYENYYYIRYNSEDSYGTPSVSTQTLKFTEEGSIYSSSNKQGYLFSHWIDGNGKVYNYGDKVVGLLEGVGQYLDLYVQWKEITYTASYRAVHKNQLIGSQDIGVKTFNEEFVLIDCTYTIDGYEFDYWKINSKAYYPGDTVSKLTSTNNSTVYIYATFTPKQYSIIFNGNGATSGSMENQVAFYETECQLNINQFVNGDLTFVGWDYNGTTIADNQKITKLTDKYQDTVVLTAIWSDGISGSGSQEDPYLIDDYTDFRQFSLSCRQGFDTFGKYYKITSDIDFEDKTFEQITKFEGTIDGDGHVLKNIQFASSVNIGLINRADWTKIRNLGIENFKCKIEDDIEDTIYAGAFIANSERCLLDNCFATGSFEFGNITNIYCGGLVGKTYYNWGISSCYTVVDVTIESVKSAYIGGIMGYLYESGGYSECYSECKIKANVKRSCKIAGIVGCVTNTQSSPKVKNCFVKADFEITLTGVNIEKSCFISDMVCKTETTKTENNFMSSLSNLKYLNSNNETNIELDGSTIQDENLKNESFVKENIFKENSDVWTFDGINYPTLIIFNKGDTSNENNN